MAEARDDSHLLSLKQSVSNPALFQANTTEQTRQRIAFATGLFKGNATLYMLLDSLAQSVIVIDTSGHILLVNERALEMFGYKANELEGRALESLMPERFRGVHTSHVQSFFDTPHVRPMGVGLDLAGRRGDGSEFPVEISLSYLDTDAGRMGIALVTDISQRKRVERELKQRNRELDAFARTVAHDLKSSLQIILGFSMELYENREEIAPEDMDTYLMEIAGSSAKMANVIDSLLLFASLRKGDIKTALVEMNPVVDEALRRLQLDIKRRQAQIVVQADLPPAAGYAAWVEEIWLNYISNALKYGGEPPRVEISGIRLPDGRVRYAVKDNGAGLAADQHERLFDEFTRLDSDVPQGYGLGLSIVQQIVSKLHGEVGIESAPGAGSVFSFTLPGEARRAS